MKSILRMEIKKAFHNKLFYLSIAIGLIFVFMSAGQRLYTHFTSMEALQQVSEQQRMSYNSMVAASNLYNNWIGGESITLGPTLFYTLLPLLAILPYGWSYAFEKQSGYIKTVIPQTGKKRYFLAKTVATFLSGGVAICIPLLTSLLVISLFIPAVSPDVIYNMYYPMRHGTLWANLFYTHPLIFSLLYIGVDFVFAGLFACLAISAAFVFENKYSAMIVPYFFVLLCHSLRNFLRYISYVEISPLYILHPTVIANYVKCGVVVFWLVFFFILTVPLILIRGTKNEVY